MQLASLLTPGLIFLKRSYDGKDEMIEDLVRELFRTRYKITCTEEEVKTALREREDLGGTVFPTGLAVPHARLNDFDDILIAVCVPSKPVSAKGMYIRLMVLVLTGHETSNLYLNTLAAFSKISSETQYFEQLITAETPQSFIQILKKRNFEVKKEILVKAIMSRDFNALHLNNTIKDAIDIFYKHKTTYVPVLDDDNLIAGEFSIFDVFEKGIPHYAQKIQNLNFMKTFEPFEELLEQENAIEVRDVMKKCTVTLGENSSMIEAIMKFTLNRRRNIPVLRDRKLVGVVSLRYIIHKVLRA